MKINIKNLSIISGIAAGLMATAYLFKGTNLILKEKKKKDSLLDKVQDRASNLKDQVVKASEKGIDSSKSLLNSLTTN